MQQRRSAGRFYLRQKICINALPGFYIYLSVLLLILPLPWLCSALLAGLLHELGHITAIKVFGVPIYRITLKGAGASIQTQPMSPGQELICAAAGPATGILIASMFPVLPKLAFCGLLQSVFNLLPVHLFDGSRIIRSIAVLLMGERRGTRVFRGINWIGTGLLAIGCILLIRFSLGASVLGLFFLLYSVKRANAEFR